jgi:protein-S-isoprenylcysteine O-methyltransferase Ste14
MLIVDIVIPVVWGALLIFWIAAAIGSKPTRSGRSWSFLGVRIAVLIVIILLIRAGAFSHATGAHSPWLQGFGLGVFFSGIALAIWARVELGRNWGMPMSQRVDPDLITNGPYRYIRHPIYSGIILGMTGTTMAVGLYWLFATLAISGYFIYSATVEERNLERRFPDAYRAYKQKTKMLIPFVF